MGKLINNNKLHAFIEFEVESVLVSFKTSVPRVPIAPPSRPLLSPFLVNVHAYSYRIGFPPPFPTSPLHSMLRPRLTMPYLSAFRTLQPRWSSIRFRWCFGIRILAYLLY